MKCVVSSRNKIEFKLFITIIYKLDVQSDMFIATLVHHFYANMMKGI